ncbi:MAG TPA: universal stress protein [Chloroflexota bacterium]|nr:universal stress protein [Chloroflexota bacterium]
MRRILIPLDGTAFGETILPDARRVAGPDGELILIKDASILGRAGGADVALRYERHRSRTQATDYLESVATILRSDGARVQTYAVSVGDAAIAIDEAARRFHADMIACATHGRGVLGRLVWGSVARRALVCSPVPVLLRHIDEESPTPNGTDRVPRRILIPLDGSPQAERVLPLARQIGVEWDAELVLTQVISHEWLSPVDRAKPASELSYLERIATTLPERVEARLLVGPVADALVAAVKEWDITDVLMASHGRTGLSRVILGSVADGLVHRLHCPIVIVPALVPAKVTDEARQPQHSGSLVLS